MKFFPKTYAIDWDGTVIKDKQYPRIGEPKPNAINVMKRMLAEGSRIIIWTCRGGMEQQEGIRAKLNEYGIFDFMINEEFPDSRDFWAGSTSPKVFADVYIDDRGIHTRGEIDWYEVEELLFEEVLDRSTK